jgi:hypothetical protein
MGSAKLTPRNATVGENLSQASRDCVVASDASCACDQEVFRLQ